MTATFEPTAAQPVRLTSRSDWQSDQEVRWCPGCGDYSILAAVQLALPDMAVNTENTVMVSGIGCAARFPYYMDTYGIHSIHGRGPAFATGIALARPDLDVWVIGGDGDLLSIGGNHLIHALRRNIDITILLFDNQIYGLTKGQYSPTSEQGKTTPSTPYGATDWPVHPLSLALGAEASFVARTHDMDRQHMMETFKRAHAHRGAAFVEVLQNCNVFNDGAYGDITSKDAREEMVIPLVHGSPIRFGAGGGRGVMVDDTGALALVDVAEVGESALLVHDEHRPDPAMAMALSRLAMDPHSPTPFGVFRSVERPIHRTQGPAPTATSGAGSAANDPTAAPSTGSAANDPAAATSTGSAANDPAAATSTAPSAGVGVPTPGTSADLAAMLKSGATWTVA